MSYSEVQLAKIIPTNILIQNYHCLFVTLVHSWALFVGLGSCWGWVKLMEESVEELLNLKSRSGIRF